jgi:hypothetical protein
MHKGDGVSPRDIFRTEEEERRREHAQGGWSIAEGGKIA